MLMYSQMIFISFPNCTGSIETWCEALFSKWQVTEKLARRGFHYSVFPDPCWSTICPRQVHEMQQSRCGMQLFWCTFKWFSCCFPKCTDLVKHGAKHFPPGGMWPPDWPEGFSSRYSQTPFDPRYLRTTLGALKLQDAIIKGLFHQVQNFIVFHLSPPLPIGMFSFVSHFL